MEGYDLKLAKKDDPVYTKLAPFNMFYYQEPAFEHRATQGAGVPMFSEERRAAKKGSRKFFCSSYAQMFTFTQSVPMLRRVYYETIVHDMPCHFYIDADFAHDDLQPGAPHPDFEGAIDTHLRLLDEARAKIFRVSQDPLWDFAWKDVVISTLISDNAETKSSRHLVLHLPGNRMLCNGHEHAKRWHKVADELGRLEFGGDDSTNPLVFLHRDGTYHHIVDDGVYTPNRHFRLIGNVKMKPTDAQMKGYLWPACTHDIDLSCEDANCLYRIQHRFSEHDFLSNLVTFVPLRTDGSGLPVTPALLRVPDSLDANLRSSKRAKYSTIAADADERDGPAAATTARVPRSLLFDGGGSNHSFASGSSRDGAETVQTLCRAIGDMLTRQTGYRCTHLYDRGDDLHIFASDSRECELKFQKTGERSHASNHVTISCRLALPFPTFNVICRDPECQRQMEYRESMTPEEKARIPRVELHADPIVFRDITPRIAAYMDAQQVTAAALAVAFGAAGKS